MASEEWNNIVWASSPSSVVATKVLTKFQYHIRDMLEETLGKSTVFTDCIWQRESGKWGGGSRLVAGGPDVNRASINFSQVQYENIPEKRLNAATALSVIIHPRHAHCPSLHLHISWTEMKEDKAGTWRMMVDLNPSILNESERDVFSQNISKALGEHAHKAKAEGDKYFYIPVLERHRGAVHYYLEGYSSNDSVNSFEQDIVFVESFAEEVVQSYKTTLESSQKRSATAKDEESQLAYHTLYFFQVTTLDRGSIAGLVIHGQNDIGILGSLPEFVDRELLTSWLPKMSGPSKELHQKILDILPNTKKVLIDNSVKKSLAEIIRGFYRENPDAMKFLARGSILPHSNQKHQSK